MCAAATDPDAELRRLRERLARSERLLGLNELLVAGLVHDLRTPLMAVKLSAEVALARAQETAVQQAARRIRTSSDQMARVFDHLLNLSRVGEDVPELDLAPADLMRIAEGVLEECRQRAPDVQFEVTRDGDFQGLFDAALLHRTIANFVGTALAHAGQDRRVSVHCDGSHRDRLTLRVSVPGVIPADEQERLYAARPNVAGREVTGLGLGLEPVDRFVRAHGGSLVGRSRSPDGTVFELLLPRGTSDLP